MQGIEVYCFDIGFNGVCIVTINYHFYVFGQVPELTYAGCCCIQQLLFPRPGIALAEEEAFAMFEPKKTSCYIFKATVFSIYFSF